MHAILPSIMAQQTDRERVADDAFIRALYAEHGGALLRYALHLTSGDRQRQETWCRDHRADYAGAHPEATRVNESPSLAVRGGSPTSRVVPPQGTRSRPPETRQENLCDALQAERRGPDARVVGGGGGAGVAAAGPPLSSRPDLLRGCSVNTGGSVPAFLRRHVKSHLHALKALKLAQGRGWLRLTSSPREPPSSHGLRRDADPRAASACRGDRPSRRAQWTLQPAGLPGQALRLAGLLPCSRVATRKRSRWSACDGPPYGQAAGHPRPAVALVLDLATRRRHHRQVRDAGIDLAWR